MSCAPETVLIMNKRLSAWRNALIAVTLGMLAVTAGAQTVYYVRSGATGSNNGSDWNNAYTDLPSSLQRGATYYVAAGTYGSHNFSDAQSGTTLIVIKKATTTDFGTSTGWQSSYGGGQAVFQTPFTFNQGYYTINGQARTTMSTGYGIHLVNGGSQGINISVGSTAPSYAPNVTLTYVEIEGSHSLGNSPTDVGVLADDTQVSGQGANNLLVQYRYIHNVGNCPFLLRHANGITLEHNYVRYNNYTSANHCEAISSAEANNNFTVRYNFFEDCVGSAWIYTASGADWPANTISNWWIYGNVFQYSYTNQNDTTINNGPTDWGVVALISIACYGEFRFCNNTIVNLNNNAVNVGGGQQLAGIYVGEGYTTTADKFYVQNNLWLNCNEVDALPQGQSQVNGSYFAYITNLFWDHNTYISTTAVDSDPNKQVLTANTTNWLANWFSENDHLITNTAAGTVLAAPFNMDPDGNTRTTWSRGAYEFGATSTNPPVISSPGASLVTDRSATIAWTTDKQATSILQYGLTTSYGTTVSNGTLVTSHSVAISNLTASTTYHYLVKSADAAGHLANSADLTFTTQTPDTTPPTVTLTAPLAGATLAGTTTFAATATDNAAVASVQFLVDGQLVGSPILISPYTYSWNSTSVTNGTHSIQARAIDTASNAATSAAASVTVQNVVSSGLVGYWTFDEGAGTSAADFSGSGNTATLSSASWGTGRVGPYALSVNGSSASASAADVASEEFSGNMSVALWVNHTALPAANSWMYYLDKGQNSSENYGTGAYSDASGNARLFFEFVDSTGTARYYTQTNGLALGTAVWTHLAFVFDHTNSLLTFYNNGLAVGSVSVTASLKGTTDPLIIGQQNISGFTFPMNGLVDDLRLYNRALSASEVSSLAGVGSGRPPAPSGFHIVGVP